MRQKLFKREYQMINAGEEAPDFLLPAHFGEPVKLSSFKGKKNVVLSFHIHSFTGGWTHQVSSFRLYNEAFEETDTQVLGISCNSKAVQAAFAGTFGSIPYPILSDFYTHGKATQSFGVFNDETGVPKRSVFLIDKKGIVRFSKIYDQAIDLNPSDILAEVNKLWLQLFDSFL